MGQPGQLAPNAQADESPVDGEDQPTLFQTHDRLGELARGGGDPVSLTDGLRDTADGRRLLSEQA